LHCNLLAYTTARTLFRPQSFVSLVLISNKQPIWEVNHTNVSAKTAFTFHLCKNRLACSEVQFYSPDSPHQRVEQRSKASSLHGVVSCPPVLLRPFIISTGAAECCVLKAMGTLQRRLFAIGLLSFISFLMFFLSYSYPFPPITILLLFFVFFTSV